MKKKPKATADQLEKCDRIIEESEAVIAECDMLNDHTAAEEMDTYGAIKKAMWDGEGHAWGRGADLKTKDTGIDAPYIWPSKLGRVGRLHLCKTCEVPQPYSEFDRTPGSAIFTGKVCNSCIEKHHMTARRRRTGYVPRNDSLGLEAAGEASGRS